MQFTKAFLLQVKLHVFRKQWLSYSPKSMSTNNCTLWSVGVFDLKGGVSSFNFLSFFHTFSVMFTDPAKLFFASIKLFKPSLLIAVESESTFVVVRGIGTKSNGRRGDFDNWRVISANKSLKNQISTAVKKTRLRKKKASGAYSIFNKSLSEVRNAMATRESGMTPLTITAITKSTAVPAFLSRDSCWRR